MREGIGGLSYPIPSLTDIEEETEKEIDIDPEAEAGLHPGGFKRWLTAAAGYSAAAVSSLVRFAVIRSQTAL